MKRIITAFLFFVLILPVCKAQGTSPEDRYKSFQTYKKEYLKKYDAELKEIENLRLEEEQNMA